MNIDIQPSGYGTELSKNGISSKNIDNPLYQAALMGLISESIRLGAGIVTTNTFGARTLLKGNHPEEYQRELEGHIHLANYVAARHTRDNLQIAVSFGPYGECYHPSTAPETVGAQEFHGWQFSFIKGVRGIDPSRFEILAETIGSLKEAMGIMMAAKRTEVETVLSFVVNKAGQLLDGTPVHEAIRAIDEHTGGYGSFGINCSGLPGTEVALNANREVGQRERLTVIYPNSSDRPQCELEGCAENGDHHSEVLEERAKQLIKLAKAHEHIKRLGGCCGCGTEFVKMIRNALENPYGRMRTATV